MQYNHSRCKRIHITKDFQTEEIFTSKSIHTTRTPTPNGYPLRKGIHAEWVPGLLFSPLSERPERSVKKGRLFERSEFLPFSEGKGTSRRKKSALNFSLVLSFVSRQKKEHYSANMGSQAGRRMGFCLRISDTFFVAYLVSITRRNMYSLNQSSVMMRWP